MSSSFTRFSPECLRAPVLESARRDSTTGPAFQVPGRSIYFILSSILWIRLHNVRGAVSSFTSILSLLLRLPLAFFFLFFLYRPTLPLFFGHLFLFSFNGNKYLLNFIVLVSFHAQPLRRRRDNKNTAPTAFTTSSQYNNPSLKVA